ncbi:MAG: ribonuclease D [Deltaproteobacteria bacterium]|nr:ribonuclease D [Deltaproteobacteria bacterium]
MYLKTDIELEQFCNEAKKRGLIALDLEFIPENTYYPRLALIQVAIDSNSQLIDPLSKINLVPLYNIVSDESVIKIVHAGTQDLAILYHNCGILPKSIFDTQIACSFLNMGLQTSYGSMIQELLGITLKKAESYSDWMRRPLSKNQENYAIEDVKFLTDAYILLMEKLSEKDRFNWLKEDLHFYETADFYKTDPFLAFYKVKRRPKMSSKNILVLQHLAAWREEEAQRRNLPRKRVLSDDSLILISKITPVNQSGLENLKMPSGDNPKKYAKEIVDAVVAGLKSEKVLSEQKNIRTKTVKGNNLFEFLYFSLKSYCLQNEISMERFAKRGEIEELCAFYEKSEELICQSKLMQGWRGEFAGKFITKSINGEVNISFNPVTSDILIK